jgi:hypothetical protein
LDFDPASPLATIHRNWGFDYPLCAPADFKGGLADTFFRQLFFRGGSRVDTFISGVAAEGNGLEKQNAAGKKSGLGPNIWRPTKPTSKPAGPQTKY